MNVSLLKIVEKSEEIEKIFIACDTNLQGAENPSWIFAKRVTCREVTVERGYCKERGQMLEMQRGQSKKEGQRWQMIKCMD